MSFATPLLLLGLLLLPLIVLAYRRLERRPSKYAVRYTNLDVLADVVGSTRSWRRHAGLALFLLALAALLVGFARPSMTRLADREEATIVLVIDVSGSMQAEDVEPTRLEAAQRVVRGFLKELPKRFKVGVVAFSETAEVAAPATDDRQLAIDAIDYLYPQRGTAIGDAIARGVEVARAADTGEGGVARPAAIVLLSDGSQTEGILLPQEGAARAKSFKIPVHAVALGTPEGIVEFNRFGGTRIIPVPPDPATLRQIATSTGGRFYEAENVDDLRDAYDKMDSLVSKVERKQEVTFAFLAGGLVLLLAAAAVAVVTFPEAAVRLVALAVAAAALFAGCSGDEDDEATPATTATQTVTVRESTPTETAAAPDRAGSLAAAVERVLPSLVNVQTTSFGGGEGEASGVVLQRDGLILTNNHVVEGTTGVTIAFNDGVHKTPLEGTVIGTAPERDLAVVRVEASDLTPVELARSSALRLGDVVIALGFPAGLGGPTVTSGIVSGLDRTIEGPNGDLTGLLQTDAAINPGNSGGPLVDRSGRLVGINTAGIRNADTENIGFAIAIDEALPVIARISDAPPAAQGWLGIAYSSVDSESAAVQLGLDSSTRGAAVTVVYPGGPADKADMAVGDVIIAADDVPIRNANALAKVIAEREIGDELDLELIDSRGPRLVTVEVARRTPGALP